MRLHTKLSLLFIFSALVGYAQDTIVLKNKKTIVANSIEIKETTISYQQPLHSGQIEEINPEKVFSIKYQDGHTSLISELYKSDTIVFNKGNRIPIKSYEFKEYSIEYRKLMSSDKLNTIKPECVSEIKHKDGHSTFISEAFARDTIVLINGKSIPVKSSDLKDYSIFYRKPTPNTKLKTIDPERVFSIRYKDGNERVIYYSDTLDPVDFKPEEMRMFIKGEQDADKYYKNNFNKGTAFVLGAGGGLLGFYGLAVPPLYATIVGAFSPKMEKQKVSDPALLQNNIYREGYEKKARDRKIRNAMIGGLIGFVAGSVTLSIIY